MEPLRTNLHYYFSLIKISDECKLNPDNYFNAGDHLCITRKGGLYTHDCIYMGNKKVVHIFLDENSSKSCARAKEDSWQNYVGFDENDGAPYWGTVYVVVYRLKIRKPEEILKTAKLLASEEYAKGQYNFFLKNCQHFATYCCTGKEFSIGAHNFDDGLKQILMAFGRGPRVSQAAEKTFTTPLEAN